MGDTARVARAQSGGVTVLAKFPVVTVRMVSLRSMVLSQTGQDVSRCCGCTLCEDITDSRGDVSLAMVLQWIRVNDDRALTCRTVWSDEVLRQAEHACTNQLDIPAVLRTLRAEARRRGLR